MKAGKSSHKVKERACRLKKFAMETSSGRLVSVSPSSPNSPISTEEATLQITPQIPKRKRSSPSRVPPSVPIGTEQSKTTNSALARPASIPSAPSIAVTNVLTSSPDPDDHLPIKKLKTQNLQGSISHTNTSIQTPKPISSFVNIPTTSPVNIQSSPIAYTQSSTMSPQLLIVNLDSDDE